MSAARHDPSASPSPVAGYAIAALAVMLATLVRGLLDPLLGDGIPHATYFAAVLVAAWYGGVGPGIIALVLGLISVVYLFVPLRYTFQVTSVADQVGLV